MFLDTQSTQHIHLLEEEVAASKTVLLFLTHNVLARHWVQIELRKAFEHKVTVIPVWEKDTRHNGNRSAALHFAPVCVQSRSLACRASQLGELPGCCRVQGRLHVLRRHCSPQGVGATMMRAGVTEFSHFLEQANASFQDKGALCQTACPAAQSAATHRQRSWAYTTPVSLD